MRHLNQDPLENFFGAVRSHGCRNTNPTPENFEGAFATLLINNMSSVHAPVGANCENDFCDNLYSLIVTEECKATIAPATCNFEKIPVNIVLDVNTKKDPQIIAPLQYITGYLIRNVKQKIFKSCQQCNTDVIASEGTEYIKYREYAGKRWLCSPTDAVVQCISAIQDITNTIIKECIDQNCTKEFIKTYLITLLEFDFLNCLEHKEEIIQYLVNSTSRFFLYNYCKDINKILNGKSNTYDDEDCFQMKAKKYYKKCFKRKNK